MVGKFIILQKKILCKIPGVKIERGLLWILINPFSSWSQGQKGGFSYQRTTQ